MEGGESPLDVLSRAATMVQANQAVEAGKSKKFYVLFFMTIHLIPEL